MTIGIDDDLRSQINCPHCIRRADGSFVNPGDTFTIQHTNSSSRARIATDGQPLVVSETEPLSQQTHLFIRYLSLEDRTPPYYGRMQLCGISLDTMAAIAERLSTLTRTPLVLRKPAA